MQHEGPLPKVKDVMTKNVIWVTPDLTVRQTKELMRLKGIAGLPVMDRDQKLLGVISVADIIKAMEENQLHGLVADFMTKEPIFLREDDTVGQALRAFRQYKFGRFPVLDKRGRVVGIITGSDIVARLAQILEIDKIDETLVQSASSKTIDDGIHTFTYEIQSLDFERAGEGASTIKRVLLEMGVKPEVIRRCAIASYEAEMNVVIHANNGVLKAQITPAEVSIMVEDYGPGIKDINLAMKPGYSTAPDRVREMGFGAGMGLPNIKKSADEFYIESSPEGTRLTIKIKIE